MICEEPRPPRPVRPSRVPAVVIAAAIAVVLGAAQALANVHYPVTRVPPWWYAVGAQVIASVLTSFVWILRGAR